MQMTYFPEVVQVIPHSDHTVSVYFSDGKIVSYDVKALLEKGVFRALKDVETFMGCCTVMNGTLAWDVSRTGDPTACIDIDPDTLYSLKAVKDELSAG